ncbi:MAG: DHH family phosphoesterase [Sutterella wadsworthensis]
MTSVAGRDVYLVDYSDKAQAPADIDECNLKGIVDHHKLGDVTSTAPLECIIWTAGCTNTILKRMYDYMGFEIPANIAGAMLCAILSDTVIFKSPTTTDMDRRGCCGTRCNRRHRRHPGPWHGALHRQVRRRRLHPALSHLPRLQGLQHERLQVGVGQLELISMTSSPT